MDALELLKADHERIRDLFEQLGSTNGQRGEKLIFQSLDHELRTHTRLEETVFYPAFRLYDELKPLVEQGRQDHAALKEQLAKLEKLSATPNGEFRAQLEVVQKCFLDHIQMEEGEFFPKVRALMKRPERERLGRHVQASRDEMERAA